jgi:hypothetical protein
VLQKASTDEGVKTMRTRAIQAFLAAVAAAAAVSVGAQDAPADHKAAFERLKALSGSWKGHHTTPDGPEMTVEYALTGNGTAVMERLFAGSPHEMLSVYYLDAGELVLTHYCAMGNQPRMKLVSGGPNGELRFDFVGGTNLDPARSTHIHSGRVATPGPDQLEADWNVWSKGQQTGTNRIFVRRVGR